MSIITKKQVSGSQLVIAERMRERLDTHRHIYNKQSYMTI